MATFQEFFQLGLSRDLPSVLDFPDGKVLNLGPGTKLIEGSIPIGLPGWNANTQPIPFGDESCTGVHAYHFLEHVENPTLVLQEIQRVLKPGGVVNIVVPYYRAQMAFQDLNHKHFFCEDSWKELFSNSYYDTAQDSEMVEWHLKVHFNLVAGIVERNMALFTQMVKE